jgi:hypothetical protein
LTAALADTWPHTVVAGVLKCSRTRSGRPCRQHVGKCLASPICGAHSRTGAFVARTGDQTGQEPRYSWQFAAKRALSGKRAGGPGPGRRGAGGGGQAGRRSASPVPRAHFVWLFFLHAELQDPQIEKHGKTETKTDQGKKHVCFLQTEDQFVVFAYLGGTLAPRSRQDTATPAARDPNLNSGNHDMSRLSALAYPNDAPIHGLADIPPRLLPADIGCGTLAPRSRQDGYRANKTNPCMCAQPGLAGCARLL